MKKPRRSGASQDWFIVNAPLYSAPHLRASGAGKEKPLQEGGANLINQVALVGGPVMATDMIFVP